MTAVVSAGALLTGAIMVSTAQLAQSASSSGGTAAAAKSTPPGQTKKPSPPAPPPKNLVLTPNPMTVTELLAPGVSIPKTLTVANPNNQDVILQSVTVAVSALSPSPTAGPCSTPADYGVEIDSPAPVEIKKNSSQPVNVRIVMHNRPVNQNGCKSKTFTFTLTAVSTSN